MAFVAVTKIENGSGPSASLSIGTPTAGDLLIHCGVGSTNSATTLTVTDSQTNTWTTDHAIQVSGAQLAPAYASAPNVAGGATTVTVSWNSSTFAGFTSFIQRHNNNPTTGVLDVVGALTQSTDTAVSTGAVTNNTANVVFVAVFGNNSGTNGATITPTGSGWTQPVGGSEPNGSAFLVAATAYKYVTSIGAQTMTWTDENIQWSARGAAYKVNAAAATFTPLNPPRRRSHWNPGYNWAAIR